MALNLHVSSSQLCSWESHFLSLALVPLIQSIRFLHHSPGCGQHSSEISSRGKQEAENYSISKFLLLSSIDATLQDSIISLNVFLSVSFFLRAPPKGKLTAFLKFIKFSVSFPSGSLPEGNTRQEDITVPPREKMYHESFKRLHVATAASFMNLSGDAEHF